MMEKAIGLNVESQSAFTLAPGRARYRAPVIVVSRRRAFDREGAKAVLALDGPRRCRETPEVERFFPDQLPVPPKRRGCEIVCAYVVAVAARDRAVSRVKLITHFEGCRNPYIIRKNGVHRSSESERAPFVRHAQSRGLPARVYSRICPPGTHDRDGCSAQPEHRRLEFTLNRPLVGLPLPAGKARAIVVQHKLHGTRQHRVKLAPEDSLSRNVTH